MSSAVASVQPSPNADESRKTNGTGNGVVSQTPSNGQTAASNTSSSAVAGLPQPSMTSIPPHMQQILMSMNKEKLQQMVVRMKTLQANGETEQSSQEYANLVNTFRYFQQVQSMRQQQGECSPFHSRVISRSGAAVRLISIFLFSTPAKPSWPIQWHPSF
jgi:hypothetical protein